jgi:hypothetical protein
VSGRGWTALNRGGTLEGHIYFHLGDDSAFRAERLREGPGGRRTKHGASGPCWGGDADPFGSQVAASRGDGGHLGRRFSRCPDASGRAGIRNLAPSAGTQPTPGR